MRSTVLGLLDTFAWSDKDVAAEAKRRFDAHFTDPSVLPSEYKSTVYRIVLQNGGVKEYEAVLRTFTETEDNSIRKYCMNTLGATRDPALRKRTLDWAVKSGEVKLQDFFYPIGSVSQNIQGAEIAWDYFKQNFQTIKGKLAKASPSLMDAVIVYSANRFCTKERADEIEKFFQANPLPSSERRINQLLENMRTSAQMLDNISKSQLASAAFWH